MQRSDKLKTFPKPDKLPLSVVWERLGITKHMGGVYATRRLIGLCGISPNQNVLEIGCGTGYTSCLLAKKYQVGVAALDINPKVLEYADKRIREEGVGGRVRTIEADAHSLPFPANSFDVVLAESVLALCDKKKVASEAYRVLKPGGVFGANESTYLKPPPVWLIALLSELTGADILTEDGWQAVFREAGFEDIASATYTINFRKEFLSRLKEYGLRKYLSAWVQSIFDPDIRGIYFNKKALRALFGVSYLGYGLYVGKKPDARSRAGS